jgi:signal peptidase II
VKELLPANFYIRLINAGFIIAALVLLDQFSKNYFISFLKTQPGYMLNVNGFLDIVYTWNYGISFGLFSKYQKYSNAVFVVCNSLIILYLLAHYIWQKDTSKAYLLIISGGIGNLLDRFIHGAVFDFLHCQFASYSFPVFNIADGLISVGIFFFVLQSCFFKKTDSL